MSAPEWLDEARAMRAEGKTYREIAARLEVSRTKLWNALHPERAREHNLRRHEAKREWERQRAGRCGCGEQLSDRRVTKCDTCKREWQQRRAALRIASFAALREAGLTNKEIAEVFGVKPHVVATALHRAERYGIDVAKSPYYLDSPYRNGVAA